MMLKIQNAGCTDQDNQVDDFSSQDARWAARTHWQAPGLVEATDDESTSVQISANA